ncbi:Rap1a/Tai family immunity protein [Falsiroseomonas sp. HW251]|uniref:Rap1a/Tai family immunity protein n=1 Tax=Falsiroseomonas sp. HW251 TaxID=3390998 RepID=UPI003D30F258
MRFIAIAALAAGLCLPALPGRAQVTGDNFGGGKTSDLAALCGATQTDQYVVSAVNFCHGFLMGVGQLHSALTQPGVGVRPYFCLPNPRPSLDQVRGAFVGWVAANPQYGATPAVEGVTRFGEATYPCPPSQTRASRRGATQ